MIEAPGIFVVFTAGMLSFLTPCVLPIIPSYISYIAGISLTDSYLKLESRYRHLKLFTHAFVFSLGFVSLFMAIGASIGYISELFLLHKRLFEQIGGAVIILFGLSLVGILTLERFFRGRQIQLPAWAEKFSYIRSFLLGFILRSFHTFRFLK